MNNTYYYPGHFLLTMLLEKDLVQSSPARVVNVSALAYQLSNSLDFDLFTPGKSNSLIPDQKDNKEQVEAGDQMSSSDVSDKENDDKESIPKNLVCDF